MPRASSDSGRAAPGRRRPSFRDDLAQILGGLRGHGWVCRLSMLWVVMGAGGAAYAFVCTTVGGTPSHGSHRGSFFWLWKGGTTASAGGGHPGETCWAVRT